MEYVTGRSVPKPHINILFSNFTHKSSPHQKIITQHHFNHKLEIFVPSLGNQNSDFPSPEDIGINNSDFYYFYYINSPLVDLLHPDYVKNDFFCVSIGSWMDKANCLCILPNPEPRLIISVDKDTYQQLGLAARKSLFPKRGDRYIVEIPLNEKFFNDPKNHVIWAFTNRVTNVEVLAGSRKDLETKNSIRLPLKTNRHLWQDMDIPIFDSNQIRNSLKSKNSDSFDSLYLEELFHCIGAIHSKMENFFNMSSSPLASTYTHSFQTKKGKGESITWKGLVPVDLIQSKLNLLQDLVNKNVYPWACLTVWGFTDVPVSWNNKEHSVLYNGENDFTFVILPDNNYLLFLTVGLYDAFNGF